MKLTERAKVILKNGTRDFQNSPLFQRSACFYVTASGNLEFFQHFNFETDFLENGNLFQKNRGAFFLVESIKTEIGSFPYRIAISEANVKTNRKVSTKWTYHEELRFSSNYFIFLKNFVSV